MVFTYKVLISAEFQMAKKSKNEIPRKTFDPQMKDLDEYFHIKQTKNGICYLVWGDNQPKLIKYEQNSIQLLQEKSELQEKEIELLKKNLEELKKLINK